MPKTQQNTNIQQMDAKTAERVLNNIYRGLQYSLNIDQQKQQTIIDAVGHPSFGVVEHAFLVIRRFRDKQLFASVLLKYAADHTRPHYAAAAYEGMRYAEDLAPFNQVIERGVLSHSFDISSVVVSVIDEYVRANQTLDPSLNQAMIHAIEHPNPNIVSFAFGILRRLTNRQPFFASLQKWANSSNQPPLAQAAADLLRSGALVDLSPRPESVWTVSIRNIRLDFNIEANGGGQDIDKNDAMSALCKLFDQSTKDGSVTAKAQIFYDADRRFPNNAIIDVKFPASDKGHILDWLERSVAPEFDLQNEGSGVYALRLKDHPFF